MKIVEFGTLFQFIRNGMSVKQDKSGDGLPVTRIETISNATVDGSRVGYAGLKEADCRGWFLENGDILFSHINSVEHIGKCAVYRGEPEKLVHGMNLLCLRCNKTKLIPEFAKYLIRGPEFRTRLANFTNKAVNQASVSIGNMKTIPVSVPPLAEQKRIAAILDAADALRTKRREALAQLDALLQSTFLNLFGDPVENPMRWDVVSLRSVTELENGDRSSNYPSGPDVLDSGVLFLSTKNISDNQLIFNSCQFISEKKFKSLRRGRLRRNDLVITLRGTLGSCAIFDCEFETGFINAQIMIIRPSDHIIPTFLHSLICTKRMKIHFEELSTGVAVKQLTGKQIGDLSIPLPPVPLQQKFAAIVESVERQKAAQRAHLAELDALFAALQHRAFSGEL